MNSRCKILLKRLTVTKTYHIICRKVARSRATERLSGSCKQTLSGRPDKISDDESFSRTVPQQKSSCFEVAITQSSRANAKPVVPDSYVDGMDTAALTDTRPPYFTRSQ
jgi:hypothetical protein